MFHGVAQGDHRSGVDRGTIPAQRLTPTLWVTGFVAHKDTAPAPSDKPAKPWINCDEFTFASTYESAGMPASMDGVYPAGAGKGGECVNTVVLKDGATWKLQDDRRYAAPTWRETCGRSSMSGWMNQGSMSPFGLGFAKTYRLVDKDPFWINLGEGFYDACDGTADVIKCAPTL